MIQTNQLKKVYNCGKPDEFCALHGVSVQINDGEMVAIIGKSGAGKSTLMHIFAGIDTYEDGSCLVDGQELKKLNAGKLAEYRNEKIGIVLQDFALISDYTVEENVMVPLYFGHTSRTQRKKMVADALEQVGILELAKKQTNQLSGGQKQRCAIARAIVNKPAYLLADEPTGALDSKTAKEVMELFQHLNQQGQTVIIITHDMQVASTCSRCIEVSDGCIC